MNFERFKSRVAAAADAAKQFKTFDQMAAQDEYIHSPDLNVGRGGRARRSSPKNNKEQNNSTNNSQRGGDYSSQRVNESSSRVVPSKQEEQVQSTTTRSLQASATTMPLLSVVTDVMSEKSVGSRAESASRSIGQSSTHGSHADNDSFSDDDSLDDEIGDDDDPILNMMRHGPPGAAKSEYPNRDYRTSQSNVENGNTKKNPNRFMEELDRRMSMPPDLEKGDDDAYCSNNTNLDTATLKSPRVSLTESSNKWEWMRSAASTHMNKLLSKSKQDDSRRMEMTPLTASQPTKPKDPNEDFHVTVSSSVLGAEEQAELERMRMATHAHPLTFLLDAARQNPQFVFIAFTIVLGSAAYFYSRRRGSEDGVP